VGVNLMRVMTALPFVPLRMGNGAAAGPLKTGG
jgi:hypothetical protein